MHLKSYITKYSKNKLVLYVYLPLFLIGLISTVILVGRVSFKKNFAQGNPQADKNIIKGKIFMTDMHSEENDTNDYRYYLETDDNGQKARRELKYNGTKLLMPNTEVSITGGRIEGADGSILVDETSGANLSVNSTSANSAVITGGTGYRRVALVLLYWSDLPASATPADATAARTWFSTIKNYFYDESHQKLSMQNDPGDTYGWANIGVPYSCATYLNTASGNPIDTKIASLVDFSKYQSVVTIVALPGDCGDSFGSVGGWYPNGAGLVRVPSFRDPAVLEHELSHNLSGNHTALLYNCGPNMPRNCTWDATDDYELLGHPAVGNPNLKDGFGLSAFHKELFGWNTFKNINYVIGNGTYNIYSMETEPNMPQSLQICRDIDTFYSVETRNNIGHDAYLPSSMTSGVIVRLIGLNPNAYPLNDPVFSTKGPDSFQMSPAITETSLYPGNSMTDTEKGIKITAMSKGLSSASVKVEYTSPVAFCPSIFGNSENDYQLSTDFDDYDTSCGTTKYSRPEIYFGVDPACSTNNLHTAYFKFPNVQIARNTPISSAALEFTMDGPFTSLFNESITVTDGTTTSPAIAWPISETWITKEIRRSVDFKSAVQSVINSTSWSPGKTLTVKISHVSGSGERRVYSYERGTSETVPFTKLMIKTGTSLPTFTPTPTPRYTATPTPRYTPTPTPRVTATPTPVGSSTQLYPTADAYVSSGSPSTNYGSATTLSADYSPVKIAYMRFDLTSLAGRTITKAYLKLFVSNITTGTLNLKRVTGLWTEGGVTYNSKPTLGTSIRTFSSPAATGAWTNTELTTFINSNKGTIINIAVDTTSTDDFVFYSRNATSNKPYLLIQ